ncbi:hypothetical protein JRG19_01380 [Pseudoclavibacter alba]|uniref:Uncharacterized protein n=1 Tax=Pseudoclavibacter albus TaxID=272241 RepID=A0ABT2HVZ1_9MICO|nr:hypothetical protein [Pseudoclavibacter alba]MBN6777202.1 hypothetical protein [Pseudoclavibacter alba]MCT2042316.1 hypothetical protein [Pseudoclavibacter alba]
MTSAFGPAADQPSNVYPGDSADLAALFNGPQSDDGFVGFGVAEFAWLLAAWSDYGDTIVHRAGLNLDEASGALLFSALAALAARDMLDIDPDLGDLELNEEEIPEPAGPALAVAHAAMDARCIVRVAAIEGDQAAEDHCFLLASGYTIWVIALPTGARMVTAFEDGARPVAAVIVPAVKRMLDGAEDTRTIALDISDPSVDVITRSFLRGRNGVLRILRDGEQQASELADAELHDYIVSTIKQARRV